MASFFYILRSVRLGLVNIRQHKLRSFLTILGIVFGVCSVISMLSIGEGASREVLNQIRRLGSMNIIVQSVKPPRDAGSQSGGRSSSFAAQEYGLKYTDAEQLASVLPTLDVIVPIKALNTTVRYMDRDVQTSVLGTAPWFERTQGLEVVEGRFLTSMDMLRHGNVCVLGSRIARELFLFRNPLGHSVRIGPNAFEVVGVVEDASSSAGADAAQKLPSQTAGVFLPLTTMREYEGDLFLQAEQGSFQVEYIELNELIIKVKELEDVLPTSRIVEEVLAANHPRAKDYEMIVPLRLLREAQRTQAIFSVVLGSIAAISLLVGGIGIMNIMLASVSERTREIGIRRALGARQRDIMLQFLVETLILSLGGGLIGMGLGAGIPQVVTRFSGMPTVLTPDAFVLSFLVSAGVGLIFGIYPARRAAQMDPIDALRHE